MREIRYYLNLNYLCYSIFKNSNIAIMKREEVVDMS